MKDDPGQPLVDRIVNAVLYEGHILYPYRPSVKNRQRWTFGGLYPRAYCAAQEGSDSPVMQTECLVRGTEQTALSVTVRFLHLQARLVGELDRPRPALPVGKSLDYRVVGSMAVGERLLHTWQEAVEREHTVEGLILGPLTAATRRSRLTCPASERFEEVRGPTGEVVAVLVRQQQAICALVEVAARRVAGGLFNVRVGIENHSSLKEADRDEALMHSLISTHTILRVQGGTFVSLLDPPEACCAHVAACRNVGTWPVLVGEDGQTDTML